MPHLTLISGFPGCGKTTFASWLASTHGYLHVDMERGGLDRDGLRELWNHYVDGSDRDSFVATMLERSSSIVLDWNFPPRCLDLIQALRGQGFEVWWFEGYRLAARQRFLERGTEPVEAFDAHVGEICVAWRSIEPIVGPNVVNTIKSDGSFLSHETIWRRFRRSVKQN